LTYFRTRTDSVTTDSLTRGEVKKGEVTTGATTRWRNSHSASRPNDHTSVASAKPTRYSENGTTPDAAITSRTPWIAATVLRA
jgi:hypothetical protein